MACWPHHHHQLHHHQQLHHHHRRHKDDQLSLNQAGASLCKFWLCLTKVFMLYSILVTHTHTHRHTHTGTLTLTHRHTHRHWQTQLSFMRNLITLIKRQTSRISLCATLPASKRGCCPTSPHPPSHYPPAYYACLSKRIKMAS